MAGPTSSILLKTLPSEETWREIKNIVLSISEEVLGDGFSVVSTKAINGNVISSEGRPFGFENSEINSEHYNYSEEELLLIKDCVGFSPKFDLGIYAICNQEIDHKILGELSLYLAEKFDGIIDFDGAIIPVHSLPYRMKEGIWLWEKANWIDIKPYFEKMVEKIDGKIFTIEYETVNNRNWARHLCDAEFMKNWLKNKNFRMIK